MSVIAIEEKKHISITSVVETLRADSDTQEPVLREVELAAQIRLCELLSRTGMVRIPGIVYGALKAELDRVVAVGNETAGVHY
jgi:hypothetical protein